MKKSLFALAVLAAAGVAQAQSSVTLYGIADQAVRYTTHNTTGNTLQMVNGMSQSRFGLRGTEELGGGMQAIFNVENRFNADSGSLAVTGDGQLFNQAWAGLQTQAGTVTLGRQYNLMFDTVTSTYAPFGYSPYVEQYKPELSINGGNRLSNAVKYAANFSGVKIGLMAGLGEQANNVTTGSGNTVSASLGYAMGPVAVGAAVQKSIATGTDAASISYTIGGSFVAGPAKINLGTSGVSKGAAQGSSTPNDHVNQNLYFGGVAFQATPALNVAGQLYYARGDNGVAVATSTGTANNALLPKAVAGAIVVDYALSKRTDAYLESDYTLKAGKDAAGVAQTKVFGAMLGLRHRF